MTTSTHLPLYAQHSHAVTTGKPCTCGCKLNHPAPAPLSITEAFTKAAAFLAAPNVRAHAVTGVTYATAESGLVLFTLDADGKVVGQMVDEHGEPAFRVPPAPLTCCDGTGWTGNPRERCTTHYEAPGFGSAGMYS
jgi:hypothetical protein